jgi:DNA-binding MarR family transcriptional regulator
MTQKFYPVTTGELIALSGLLTDTELKIYLYLMAANPFGDRFQKLDTAVVAEHLGVNRRTVQRTLKHLETLNLIEVEIHCFRYRKSDSVDESDDIRTELRSAQTAERQQDRPSDSRIARATVGSPKRQQDRDRRPKPLPDKNSDSSKTIKTIQTFQTVTEEDFNSTESGTAKPSIEGDSTELFPSKKIPRDLLDRLGELEIPIDKKIRETIARHDISQAWGAIRHIEATAETIKSKYAVFLHQIPLQPVEKPIKGLSSEFLNWYQYARGELVEDIPPEKLPLDRYREPLVRLKSKPENLIEWRRAAGGEDLTPCTGEALRSLLDRFPGLKAKLGREEPAPPAVTEPVESAKLPEEPKPNEIDKALKAEIEKALESNPELKQKIGGINDVSS